MSRGSTATTEARRPGAMIGAFCTIGEAAHLVEVPPHVLRFWESRLSHIQPHKRGRWRYYRARDIELLRRVRRLLHDEGYTLNGVQRLLDAEQARTAAGGARQSDGLPAVSRSSDLPPAVATDANSARNGDVETTLRELRDMLAALRHALPTA